MGNFLLRIFVKDYKNVQDTQVRERYGVLSGGVGLICNLALFALKLSIGFVMHSISITADAFNNLSDGLSSVISIVGFKVAGRAPDAKHPFGYGRTEYVAGLAVSFLILMVGFEFLKSSFLRILHPEPVVWNTVLFVILAASIAVKLCLGLFNRDLGRRIQSPTLMAAMQDSMNDVVTTIVVLFGMIAARFTTLPVDGIAGVLVAAFVLWSGFSIARETLSPLLGQPADAAVAESIETIVLDMKGIVGVHDLIIHNYGVGRSLASLHAEVPDDADLVQIHEVVDEAEKLVWQKTGVYLVIHMDPISLNDKRVTHFRRITQEVIGEIDTRLSMHDFRIIDGEHRINVVFDIVVPFDYDEKSRAELLEKIARDLRARDARLRPVVTLDHQM